MPGQSTVGEQHAGAAGELWVREEICENCDRKQAELVWYWHVGVACAGVISMARGGDHFTI